ncbi:MAG: phosphoesterase, partial [Pseudomonadota bacterium]
IPNPVQANRNGSELIPWGGEALTLGGELNKLVANVTHARDAAGMHWRSDGEGNLIGEAVGIALLADYSVTYNEEFDGLTLRKFNGQRIRIQNGRVTEIAG